MNPSLKRAWGSGLAGAMLCLACPVVWAQGSPTSPTWQDANRAVAQFPRGHIDWWRWEQKNQRPEPEAPLHPDSGSMSLARAIRLAQQDAALWLEPGMSAVEAAQVRQRAAALQREVQTLWIDAVVSQQSLAHSRDIAAVAQTGAELGQRMAQVGNWSRARQIQEELQLWDARSRQHQAQFQADRALQALWQRIGAGMDAASLAQQLPLHLPPHGPEHQLTRDTAGALEVSTLQTQALKAHAQWPLQELQMHQQLAQWGLTLADVQAAHNQLNTSVLADGAVQTAAARELPVWDARRQRGGHEMARAIQAHLQVERLARQVRADVQLAVSALEAARLNAHTTQAQVLRLHTELSQETLLRYNGMLKSTWDLLTSARIRIDSVDAALQAQRRWWLAHADLLAVLAGLSYTNSAVAGGATTAAASQPQTAGH